MMNATLESRQPPRRIACRRCRLRKKKCDRAQPVCSQCRDAGETCYLLRPRNHRASLQNDADAIRSNIASLEKRLSQIEAQTEADHESALDDAAVPAAAPGQEHLDALLSYRDQESNALPLATSDVQSSPLESDSYRAPDSYSNTSATYMCGPHFLSSRHDHRNKSLSADPILPISPICDVSFPQAANVLYHVVAEMGNLLPLSVAQFSNPPSASVGASERVYFDLYFEIIQPQWPLFVRDQCEEWFEQHVDSELSGYEYRECILKVICATGALFCSSFEPLCPHLAASNTLYEQAFEKCEFQTASRSLTRLAILAVRIIYLLHRPDTEPIDGVPQTKAKACREVLRQIGCILRTVSDTHATTLQFEDEGSFAPGTVKTMIMTCFIINEVVYSSWNIPRSSDDEALDKTLWNQCSRLIDMCPAQTPSPPEHTFQIRRLQHETRRFVRQTSHLPLDDPARVGWRETLYRELNQWKAAISKVALEHDESFNHRPPTMRKMYDYCLCVLFESELLTMESSFLETLLRAAREACISFRKIQNHQVMVYFTCSALSAQFRMGLIILACFWLTKGHERSAAYLDEETLGAIEACFDTLSMFAQRWADTSVYRDTFELITSVTPFMHLTSTRNHAFPKQHTEVLVQYRDQLARRNCPKIVTSIIDLILDKAE